MVWGWVFVVVWLLVAAWGRLAWLSAGVGPGR